MPRPDTPPQNEAVRGRTQHPETAPHNALAAIDVILQEFADTAGGREAPDTGRLLEALTHTIAAAVGMPPSGAGGLAPVFQPRLGDDARQLCAVSFLRLLAADRRALDEADLHHRAFALFDETLPAVYRQLRIRSKDQTYKKERALQDFPDRVQRTFDNLINALGNLDTLPAFRKEYMRALNADANNALIAPFLPSSLLTTRLDDVFRSALAYRDADESTLLEHHLTVNEELQRFASEAESYGTHYSRTILANFALKLLAVINGEVDRSGVTKPATLLLESADKKYPLSEADLAFDLRLVLRNQGPGHAFSVALHAEASENIDLGENELFIGHLGLSPRFVTIPGRVIDPSSAAELLVEVEWTDPDGASQRNNFDVTLPGQSPGVRWESLLHEDPYALEPVVTEADLVGRSELLQRLTSLVDGKAVGNAFVTGQKRVGKTSIVRTLENRRRTAGNASEVIVYLEAGDFIAPDVLETVGNFGTALATAIRSSDERFAHVPVPTFSDSLSPLSRFIDSLARVDPHLRIVVIVDEFDELPVEIYKRGPIGNSLFLSLRSIGGKPFVGLIFVGGEKIDFVLSCQGDKLNKFDRMRVDYFDRARHWADFSELVQAPVAKQLEVTPEALAALYEATAGHPFFTKLICRTLLRSAVQRRDAYITPTEVKDATVATLHESGAHHFQHFWEDGIFEGPIETETISMTRRRFLLGLADCLRIDPDSPVPDRALVEAGHRYGLDPSTTEEQLRDFVRRDILVMRESGYEVKVPVFAAWLRDRGLHEIVTTFSDPDAILERKRRDERAFVTAEEILALVGSWGTYRNSPITTDVVRAWLNQFQDLDAQRLMFRILQGLRLYGGGSIRAKLREAHATIRSGTTYLFEGRQRKRDDFLIAFLDAQVKSGGIYARWYADENKIYRANAVDRPSLRNALREGRRDAQVLVLVDDFIGTGETAEASLHSLGEELGDMLTSDRVAVWLLAIAGFDSAIARVESAIERLALQIDVTVCDPLGEADRCFSPSSGFFADPDERERAKHIAMEYGARLVAKNPLGYGDTQAAIVFEHSTPNNSLPILWKESPDWKPLFPRL